MQHLKILHIEYAANLRVHLPSKFAAHFSQIAFCLIKQITIYGQGVSFHINPNILVLLIIIELTANVLNISHWDCLVSHDV